MNAKHQHGHRLTLWLIWIVASLLIYVLSTGPAAAVATRHPEWQSHIQSLYFPLTALPPSLERALSWYVGLWGRL